MTLKLFKEFYLKQATSLQLQNETKLELKYEHKICHNAKIKKICS